MMQFSDKSWYDTKSGIEKAVSSLESFCKLVRERHASGYGRKERLSEFIVFGRYWFDTCGNTGKANDKTPKDFFPDIPDVITKEEFRQYLKDKNGKDLSISFEMNEGNIPEANLKCAHCKKGWDITNCHDTIVYSSDKVFALNDFVGKKLKEVKRIFEARVDAIYRMFYAERAVRNDVHIDLSPEYPNPKHDWEKSAVKNRRGWLNEKSGITDEYAVKAGDEGFFYIWHYYHKACNREHLNQETEQKFREIFEKAGFNDISMQKLDNQYCPCEYCTPWFNVGTEFGTIKIGWRKRVINIDWSAVLREQQNWPQKNILTLFQEEDVTKDITYIHAWGWDKAQEYLSRIHKYFSAD